MPMHGHRIGPVRIDFRSTMVHMTCPCVLISCVSVQIRSSPEISATLSALCRNLVRNRLQCARLIQRLPGSLLRYVCSPPLHLGYPYRSIRPSRTIHSVPPIRTPLWHRPQPSSVPRSYPRCFAIVSHAYQLLNHSEYGACRCIWRETASANQGMRAHSRTWAQTDRGSSRGSGWWKMYQEMSPDDSVNNFMHFEHVCCMCSPPSVPPSCSPP